MSFRTLFFIAVVLVVGYLVVDGLWSFVESASRIVEATR